MGTDAAPGDHYVVIRERDEAIIDITRDAAQARIRQADAERETDEPHIFMLATHELAAIGLGGAWHSDIVVRDGQALLIAVVDRSAEAHEGAAQAPCS